MNTARAALLVLVLPFIALAQPRLTQLVDPFIGTGGHGHTFPGATMPFGMVQLSPDTRLTGWDSCSGYHYSDKIIYGFTHTHLSGTGISDYSDILLMPTSGEVSLGALVDGQTAKGYASSFSHRNETAQPGYYSVRLDDGGILAELTATNRVGLHRYTFPPDASPNLILDLVHRDVVLDSYLRVVDRTHIEGYRRSTGWARDQIVYFVAEFSQPFANFGISVNGGIEREKQDARSKNLKAFFSFSQLSQPLIVKVALSAVSIDGARRNLKAEVLGWNFDRVRREAEAAWNRELSRIEVTGGTNEQRKTFYTALYHTMIAPNLFMDVDGQFRGLDGKTHRAQGFTNYTVFSLWDTFRAAHPLYTIIDQKRTIDFINTFLAHYEYGGRLPVWELAGNETDTMIGYHAVPVIVDATVKGISGFDRARAFTAMKHSAELKHFGLGSYIARGYISLEDERESVSKTLEYAYDDWCIAEMARVLANRDDYQRLTKRAHYYRNVFDSETGFARPRKNGGWLTPFDPREVNFNFTEANSWQYSFFVPHDISALISLMGGKDGFVRKLDELFTTDSRTTGREQADITGLIGQYAHGNEPSHHMAYLYNYAGQAWKTQQRVRQILDSFYSVSPDGLIGNEDCGQMSAWYVLSAAGIYPVTPGQPIYALGSPLFPLFRFRLENGKVFTIKARGVSRRNLYVQRATLNGKPLRRSYLSHRDLMAGGELVFQMGARPNKSWASADADVPVSSMSGDGIVFPPVIESAASSFRERAEIRIRTLTGTPEIFFTIDGSQPTARATRYERPFTITESGTIKAVAVDRRGIPSLVTSATFNRLPHGWAIQTLSPYDPQYSGGGSDALIDGVRGNANFHVAWQGYWGRDFVAVVDLGELRELRQLGAGFLQDVGSWIWLPRRVDFELSADGQSFTHALSITHDVSDKSYTPVVRDLVGSIERRSARYVRIKATNYGAVPDWHAGFGGQAWIFIDEILIQ